MPSKFTSTAWMSGMSAAIGWVDGSWSCLLAHAFQAVVNVVHALFHRVALAWASVPAQVANDSFSHRSSHQRMVTRSPNHMCAISCKITSARTWYIVSVTLDRNRNCSLSVTQPGFSMPPGNSGTNTWSYLANGYGAWN